MKASPFMLALPALILTVQPQTALATIPKKSQPPVLTCKTAVKDDIGYTVIKAGKGEAPKENDKVTVNYKGYLTATGKEFDAGDATQFKLSDVIPGFARGLQKMQPGGKYRICIPASLGYDEAGAGEAIPPNSDLVFEVELLSFKSPPPKQIIPVAERTCEKKTATGLGYAMLQAGSGANPTDADLALIDFQTFDAASGEVREKRLWERVPISQTTAIFGEALKLMQPGSRYRFCMPQTDIETEQGSPLMNISVDLIGIRPAPVIED
jgi:FKBP-type peptidyl-prolyl cis-trans isomerase